MPVKIRPIDLISRQKERDVLYVDFIWDPVYVDPSADQVTISPEIDWRYLPERNAFISWLDTNKIAWEPCGGVASEFAILPYNGSLYIDVPFDLHHPVYQLLSDHLETPVGDQKIPGVYFYYYTLSSALKNSHHDEPGFWEKWAESF